MFRKFKRIYMEGANDQEAIQKIDTLSPNTRHLFLHAFPPFPEWIALDPNKLPKLRSLYLLNIEFERFPEWVFGFKNLKALMVRGNYIHKIPAQIIELENLESLRIENCDIHSIPEFFSKMNKLEKLSVICDFKLKSINPSSLTKNLKTLYCTPSGISVEEMGRIRSARPDLKFKSFD